MRRPHLWMGLVGVVAFLASGQYMARVHDYLRGMDDATRMLFRSTHLYLLLTSLLNLALGLYATDAPAGWRRVTQRLGSLLVLAAPPLIAVAFLHEPWLTDLDRPFSRPALIGTLVGMLLHLLSRPRGRA